ncbi:hypothetical protein F4560_006266 [Saccharothrix ecbatanensis]|uniref:Lipoprotein n=1 Tax=Saccharothrix ecbatanensis TaxID=1105145 RepID=A0A7W9HR44_9PSEU|nr:hypothetical protein [Saccharothrix ecbatanensis]MBB5806498.1 hypothetical protein [Saccharothrix ecbatanensis]
MKALKACVAVLAAGALLVGCSNSWEEEVRFKVTSITPERQVTPGHTSPPRVVMALDQDDPDALVPLNKASAEIDQFPAGIKVGDVVICEVRQDEKNNLDGLEPESEVGPCRKP